MNTWQRYRSFGVANRCSSIEAGTTGPREAALAVTLSIWARGDLRGAASVLEGLLLHEPTDAFALRLLHELYLAIGYAAVAAAAAVFLPNLIQRTMTETRPTCGTRLHVSCPGGNPRCWVCERRQQQSTFGADGIACRLSSCLWYVRICITGNWGVWAGGGCGHANAQHGSR